MAVFDTTFLIDLMREVRRAQPDRAHTKLAELEARDETFAVAVFTIAELMVGVHKCANPILEKSRVDECVALFDCISFGESTAVVYGELVAQLELRGQTIAEMDALIASVALQHGETIITRNPKHFMRVPGLIVESY